MVYALRLPFGVALLIRAYRRVGPLTCTEATSVAPAPTALARRRSVPDPSYISITGSIGSADRVHGQARASVIPSTLTSRRPARGASRLTQSTSPAGCRLGRMVPRPTKRAAPWELLGSSASPGEAAGPPTAPPSAR